jgi:hypothetical protein
VKKSNHRGGWLLRMRCERPSSHRDADKRDEIASLHRLPLKRTLLPYHAGAHGAARQTWINDVRFGSLADIEAPSPDVRFTPESGHLKRAKGIKSPRALCSSSQTPPGN